MMTMISRSIKRSAEFAQKYNLLMQAGTYSSLNASNEFKRMSRRSFDYRKIYEAGINNQDFNFMLFDRSFFQFSNSSINESLRYAFYPSPYAHKENLELEKEAQEMLDEGQLSFEEYDQMLSEMSGISPLQPIRYDLSLEQYCKHSHPAAHFHIGSSLSNRWPVSKKLTPFAFFLNILRLYYSNDWHSSEEIRDEMDQRFERELRECSTLSSAYFSESEQKRMHFS